MKEKLYSFILWEWWDKDFQRDVHMVGYAKDEDDLLLKVRQHVFDECMEEWPEDMIDEHGITKPEDWPICDEHGDFESVGGHRTEWGSWMSYSIDDIEETTKEEWLKKAWKRYLI